LRSSTINNRRTSRRTLEVLEDRNLLSSSATLTDLSTATTLFVQDTVAGNPAAAQQDLTRIINDWTGLFQQQVPPATIATTFSTALTSAIQAAVANAISHAMASAFVHGIPTTPLFPHR
jgi:hypothetical protein